MSVLKTIVPATCINHSLYDNVISSSVKHLVLAKPGRLEIYQINCNGLNLITSLPLLGSISSLLTFCPRRNWIDSEQCAPKWMLMTIEQDKFIVVAYIKGIFRVFDQFDRSPYLDSVYLETQQAVVDPTNSVLVVQICQGYLGLFRINDGANSSVIVNSQKEMVDSSFVSTFSNDPSGSTDHTAPLFDRGNIPENDNTHIFSGYKVINLDIVNVLSLTFIDGCKYPTLAILYMEANNQLKVAIYTVRSKVFKLSLVCEVSSIDSNAKRLIPVEQPLSGFMILGKNVISYYSPSNDILQGKSDTSTLHLSQHKVAADASNFTCFAKIDSDRYLVGSKSGQIHLLVLDFDLESRAIKSTNLIPLKGNLDSVDGLVHLSSTYFFSNSHFASANLFTINLDDYSFSIVQTIPNLGPILDIAYSEPSSRRPTAEIVTCSGGGCSGSLRRLVPARQTTLLQEIPCPGVFIDMWLHSLPDQIVIILTTIDSTLCLAKLTGSAVNIPLSFSQCRTIAFKGLANYTCVQVTQNAINLLDRNFEIVAKWVAEPSEGVITKAVVNDAYIAICIEETQIKVFSLDLKLKLSESFSQEITSFCIDHQTLIVSLWNSSLAIIPLYETSKKWYYELPKDSIARCMILKRFKHSTDLFLFISLADGLLLVLKISPLQPDNSSIILKYALGSSSTPLLLLDYDDGLLVSSNPVAFINLNETGFHTVYLDIEPFQFSAASAEELILSAEETLYSYSITQTPSILVKDELSLKGVCRSVLHLKEQSCFIVIRLNGFIEDIESEVDSSDIIVVDERTFEIIASYTLPNSETINCIEMIESESIDFAGFIVGTSNLQEDDEETGRIILFKLTSAREIIYCCSSELPNMVLSVSAISEEISGPSCRILFSAGSYVKECMVQRLSGGKFEFFILPHNVTVSPTACTKLAISGKTIVALDMLVPSHMGTYVASAEWKEPRFLPTKQAMDVAIIPNKRAYDIVLSDSSGRLECFYNVLEESHEPFEVFLRETIICLKPITSTIPFQGSILTNEVNEKLTVRLLIGTSSGRLLYLSSVDDILYKEKLDVVQESIAGYAKVINCTTNTQSIRDYNLRK